MLFKKKRGGRVGNEDMNTPGIYGEVSGFVETASSCSSFWVGNP